MIITIILDDQKNSKGVYKNKQVIRPTDKAFKYESGEYYSNARIYDMVREMARDIKPDYHTVVWEHE